MHREKPDRSSNLLYNGFIQIFSLLNNHQQPPGILSSSSAARLVVTLFVLGDQYVSHRIVNCI